MKVLVISAQQMFGVANEESQLLIKAATFKQFRLTVQELSLKDEVISSINEQHFSHRVPCERHFKLCLYPLLVQLHHVRQRKLR